MSAGNSPNNAFVLHKQQMNDVLRDICLDKKPNLKKISWRTHFSCINEFDRDLSKPYFYWGINPYQNHQRGRLLFSKAYIDRLGEEVEEGWWGYCTPFLISKVRGSFVPSKDRIQYSINMVREYYTDGVRAIGAMK